MFVNQMSGRSRLRENISSFFRRNFVLAAVRRRLHFSLVHNELGQLDSRALQDIGLTKDDLYRIARSGEPFDRSLHRL